MRYQGSLRTQPVLACAFAVALSACGGGESMLRSPTDARGQPSVAPVAFTTEDIAGALSALRGAGEVPALAWYGARYPAQEAVVCLALIIGCEGGLGPIHHGSVDDLDFSGFTFRARHNGVPLARKTVVADDTGKTLYRALVGWLDHGFFLVETPRMGTPPQNADDRYYRAYSAGDATGTGPDVLPGGTATWSGAMWGLLLTEPDLSEPDAFVLGDATVTVSSRPGAADLMVDVKFSGIRHEATGAGLADIRWGGLPLHAGSFGISPASADDATVSRHPASDGISGRFYGPNHEEVGGLFGRREIEFDGNVASEARLEVSGAFGARRD